MRKNIILTSVLVLMLVITSCGTPEPEFDLSLVFYEWESNGENLTDLIPTVEIPGFDWEQLRRYERDPQRRDEADVSPFYGETLTVLVEHNFFGRHRMRVMGENFMLMHPGVYVEFVMMHNLQDQFDSIYSDYEDIMCFVRTHTAPILMQAAATGFQGSFMDTEKRGFFADWLPVMANHPGFDAGEWNMNVLNASRVHGELFAFPAFQHVPFVAANRSVAGLAQMFQYKDSITANELVDFYNRHRGFEAGYYFINHYLLWYIRNYVMPNFFNVENRTVAFGTEEFVDLLLNLYNNAIFSDDLQFNIPHPYFLDEALRENFFFRTLCEGFAGFESFSFMAYEAYFINPLPIVTRDGRLLVSHHPLSHMYSWILNTHDPISQALAAEFMLFMAGVFGHGVDYRNSPFYTYYPTNAIGRNSSLWTLLGIPAKQSTDVEMFNTAVAVWHHRFIRNNPVVDGRIMFVCSYFREGYYPGTVAEFIEAEMTRLGSMEMVKNVHTEYLNMILWEEAFYFVNGTRYAEQTASRLQDRVTAYFLEWNRR